MQTVAWHNPEWPFNALWLTRSLLTLYEELSTPTD